MESSINCIGNGSTLRWPLCQPCSSTSRRVRPAKCLSTAYSKVRADAPLPIWGEHLMTEIEWSRLKANELAKLAARNAIVIIPIGSTEQHGPHLPTQVDSRLVTEIAHRAARLMSERHPTVVTPTIPFGMSEHHMSLNGTITLDYAAMAGVLGCVCHSILRDGFKRIFILNGHGGNTEGIYTFISEFTVQHRIPLAGGTYWNIAQGEIASILDRQKALLHACEAETSMMLAL